MLIQQRYLHASSLVFSMSMWFRCSCFSALSCSTAGIIIPLPSLQCHVMTAISSLNDHYGCLSCCTSGSLNGQPENIHSDSMPMCWSSSDTVLISPAVRNLLMVIHTPGIFSSLMVSWFCLDSQSAMKSCGPGLYIIVTLYWCIINSILWSLCDRLATSFLKIATIGLWSVVMLTSWVKQ